MCLHQHEHQHEQQQHDAQSPESNQSPPSFWRTPVGWGVLLLAGIAVFVLLTEHLVHLSALFPYLFLFSCLIMHVFMHRGHRHSHRSHRRSEDEASAAKKTEEESDHAS